MGMKTARKRAGLSQREVAEKLHVDQTAVSMWETGRNLPRASLLPLVANLYRCSIEELLSPDKRDVS